MALITAATVISTAAVRNIDSSHIKAVDIYTAEIDYIKKPLGSDLYDAIVANSGGTYTTFITNFVTPVLSLGVLSNIWNRLKVEVTDRGVNQFTGEGITTPQNEATEAALFEYRQRLGTYIRAMIDYAAENFDDLYDSTIDYQTNEVTYYSPVLQRMTAL